MMYPLLYAVLKHSSLGLFPQDLCFYTAYKPQALVSIYYMYIDMSFHYTTVIGQQIKSVGSNAHTCTYAEISDLEQLLHTIYHPYTKSYACDMHVTSTYMHVDLNMPVT